MLWALHAEGASPGHDALEGKPSISASSWSSPTHLQADLLEGPAFICKPDRNYAHTASLTAGDRNALHSPVQPLLRHPGEGVGEIIEHLKPYCIQCQNPFKDPCCPAPFAEKEEPGGRVWGETVARDSMSQGSPGTLTRPCHPATFAQP